MPRWRPTLGQEARRSELIELSGIGAQARDPWTTLSQGERGRALIARALITDPRLLLLDEPSTGLDVAAREQLLETLDQIHTTHPHLASVLVTHHLEELPATTTHATLLREGRVLAAGDAPTSSPQNSSRRPSTTPSRSDEQTAAGPLKPTARRSRPW